MNEVEVKKALSDFKKAFFFLEKEFGFSIIEEVYPNDDLDVAVLIYQNGFVRIEIAGKDWGYFHTEIRRLINNSTTPYSDDINNIGFGDLLILEGESFYNNSDNTDYDIYSVDRAVILSNVAGLLRRHKEIFTTGKWIDNNYIAQIKDNYFFTKYGFHPSGNTNKPDYFKQVRQEATKLLTLMGYTIKLDSAELPPYDTRHAFKQIVFTNYTITIKISIQDWRDCYNIYYIEGNGNRVFEIDLTKYQDTNEAVGLTIRKIQEYISSCKS